MKKITTFLLGLLVALTLVVCSQNIDGNYVLDDKKTQTKGTLEINNEDVKLEVNALFITARYEGKVNKSDNTINVKGKGLFSESEQTYKYKLKGDDIILVEQKKKQDTKENKEENKEELLFVKQK